MTTCTSWARRSRDLMSGMIDAIYPFSISCLVSYSATFISDKIHVPNAHQRPLLGAAVSHCSDGDRYRPGTVHSIVSGGAYM